MRGRDGRIAVVLVLAVLLTAALATAGIGTAQAGGQPVVIGGARPSSPAISGSQVVWADKYDGNWDIFLYDGLSGQTTRLTSDANDQAMPAISGNRLVYADYSAGAADIMVRTLPGGTTTRIALSGDQTDPTISGDWIAWEDHSARSSRVEARNLVTGAVYRLGADKAPAEHPRVSGDLLVYEDHSQQPSGRLDPDVVVLNLVTGFSTRVATSIATEYYATTDGRYVVWSEGTAEGFTIRGFDTVSSSDTDISDGPGEQTMPVLAGGKVYWIHNVGRESLHIDTYDFSTGARAPFYTYSSGDVVRLAVSGTNVAWVETAGARMRVRAVFNEGISPMARVAAFFAPVAGAFDSLRLATLSTGGDVTGPEVVSTSVQPGESQVPKTAGLSVFFDEALDPATVNDATLSVIEAATGDKVPATVRYSALANMVTVKPVAALADGTYTLAVDAVITDAAGNALGESELVSFSTVTAAADVGIPTIPSANGLKVSGLSSIEMSWTASRDDIGVKAYDIYRRAIPMSSTDMAGAELAATVPSTTLSTTFAIKSDEAAKSYTYYYVVVARDTVDNTSSPSVNIAPNPHGTVSATVNTSSCLRCHFVHGGVALSPKLGARSAAACYRCHGATPGNDAYGAASTMDVQSAFNDDSGIAPGGLSGTGNGGWSIHRTDNMSGSSFGRECDACHSPHRKSYDDSRTISYGRMLRKQSAPVYGTDAAPSGNAFCYECHGPTAMGYMDSFGGDGTYAATGGSHEMTATAAGPVHSEFGVFPTTRAARPNGGNLPRISCLACHNEHASPVRALVDYRQSNTTSQDYNQAGLCLACHSTGTVESDSTGTVPYSWNGRDVNAEFQSTSHHPLFAAADGPPQPLNGSWMQTTRPQFQSDTLFQTVATLGDSVELEPVSTTGVTTTLFSDGFESNNFSAWTSATNWVTSTTSRHAGNYAARQNSTSADCTLERNVDTSGKASAVLAFWLRGNTNTLITDYVRVMFKGQDGTWRQVWQKTLQDRQTTWTQYQIAIDPALYGGFGANTAFRIVARVASSTTRYQYLDDVAFSGSTAGTVNYKSPGLVTSGLIVPPAGTLHYWSTLTVNGLEQADTTMTLDVLDGATGLSIPGYSDRQITSFPVVVDLTGLSTSLYPTLKVRARLQGNSADPRTLADDFDDDLLDAAKWTDTRLNNALDPDSGANRNAFSETWQTTAGAQGTFSRWPDRDTRWTITQNWANPNWAVLATGSGTDAEPMVLTSIPVNLQGWTNVSVRFDWSDGLMPDQSGTGLDPGEYLRVQFSTNGTTWNDGWSREGGSRATGTGQTFTIPSPTSSTYVRLVLEGADGGDYGMFDNITITGTAQSTDMWPDESLRVMNLRASGAGFQNTTTDQGEFLHLAPGASAAWIDTTNWEAVVNVESLAAVAPATIDGAAKAGLMVRAGADPLTNNVRYAGVFVGGGGSGYWQYRTTAGNNATVNTVAGLTAPPKWLRLVRSGNTIGGWYSTDGSTWTSAGTSQTITATNDRVYVGLAATSRSNTTFVDATFDDFTITEVLGLTATRTPRLDDWTLTYNYTPSLTGSGKVTCSNCHNAHTVKSGSRIAAWDLGRVSDPSDTKVAPATYNAFCLGCHDGTPPKRAVGSTLVPYDVVFSGRTEPFFSGWNKSQTNQTFGASGHGTNATTVTGCQVCHDPHGSANARLLAWTRPTIGSWTGGGIAGSRDNTSTNALESNLCFQCHGQMTTAIGGFTGRTASGGTAQVNMNVAAPMAKAFNHSTVPNGRHKDTETKADLGDTKPGSDAASKRHAECVDCHNPHAAKAGVHDLNSSVAGEALRGVVGVKPTWAATNWTTATSYATTTILPSASSDTNRTDYEAYLCFKCHSSYVTLPTSGGSGSYGGTDLALEFNPSNQSYHRVLGSQTQGVRTSFVVGGSTYTWSMATDATIFKTGWTRNTMLTCTECHGDQTDPNAWGPHGSSVAYMLDSNYPTSWETAQLGTAVTGIICSKCHNSNYRNMNDAHGDTEHSGSDGRCIACHVRIPHGWKRPRLLGYTTDPAPYRSLNLTGITAKNYTPTNWGESDCGQTGCSEHSSRPSGTLWP